MSSGSSSKGLVQTTLTSAFFNPSARDIAAKRVRYFTKPPKENLDIEEPSPANATKRSDVLAEVAKETKAILPNILKQLQPEINTDAVLYLRKDVDRLNLKYCPGYVLPPSDPEGGRKGTRVKVIDEDTFNAAIALQMQTGGARKRPVVVLNMANAQHGGGGWLKGALAQEEALCYRSSLSFTLKRRFYPLPDISGIYSPTVVIIRDSMDTGHALLYPTIAVKSLPVVSVVSVAAIRNPSVTATDPPDYSLSTERELMKSKIRMLLRITAFNGHRQFVLGALGCGAFRNPPEAVAKCFRQVFEEREFGGGWWEDILFAVMDDQVGSGTHGDGNFGIFWRALNDIIV